MAAKLCEHCGRKTIVLGAGNCTYCSKPFPPENKPLASWAKHDLNKRMVDMRDMMIGLSNKGKRDVLEHLLSELGDAGD